MKPASLVCGLNFSPSSQKPTTFHHLALCLSCCQRSNKNFGINLILLRPPAHYEISMSKTLIFHT